MARRVLDVDAADELAVRFRGTEYVLGESVAGVVQAVRIAKGAGEGPEAEERILGEMLELLSPALSAVIAAEPATVRERLALRAAVTAYVGSLGQLTFRPAE